MLATTTAPGPAPFAADLPLCEPALNRDPFPAYAALRAEAAVHRAKLRDGRDTWLVWRYRDVSAAFTDERFVKSRHGIDPANPAAEPWVPPFARPLVRNSLLDFDGPEHERLRGLVQGAFTPARIEALAPRIREMSERLVDAMLERGEADLVRDFADPIPSIVIAELLGVPAEDRARFQRATRWLLRVRRARLRAMPHVYSFVRYLRRLVEERRADPRDDLLSVLIEAEEQGDRLSNDELICMCSLILMAGQETTRNLISIGLLELVTRPQVLRRLREHPDELPAAIEELARFVSPVALATERYAREPVPVGGHFIPKGGLVYLVIGSANRDPDQFAEPDRFDPDRSPNRHMGFGWGAHYCLGAALARMETRIAFETILERAPALSLRADPANLPWRASLITRDLISLPASFRAERNLP